MEKRQEESLIWLDWAKELQFIAQAGLTYSKDPFDLERFQRIREISAEIVSRQTGLSFERVTDLFCGETGFQTPKLDTRAAIFQDGKILLVEERDGTWSLPGGWVDVNQTVKTNTEKEVLKKPGSKSRLSVCLLCKIAISITGRPMPITYVKPLSCAKSKAARSVPI